MVGRIITVRRKIVIGLIPWVLLFLWTVTNCSVFAYSSGPLPTVQAAEAVSRRFKLFRARYPLEGAPEFARLHVAVIVQDISSNAEEASDQKIDGKARPTLLLYDFLPQEPTALKTTTRLLLGRDVAGNLRERELRRLPRGAVFVGDTNATLKEMRHFVSTYPDRLSLVSNSCVTFVDAFIAQHRIG